MAKFYEECPDKTITGLKKPEKEKERAASGLSCQKEKQKD